MKTLVCIFLFPLFANAASFTTPQPIEGTRHLYRGAQPLGKADVIRAADIERVVIFKNDVKGEVEREIAELDAEGVTPHHIPMLWKEIDSQLACEQTIEALELLLEGEREGHGTYVHCTAGEDRTGMIAGLARMMIAGDSTSKVFDEELCGNGYSDGNPNKPVRVVKEIEKGLTPLFFALAQKIESGDLRAETLSKNVCNDLQLASARVPTCRGR